MDRKTRLLDVISPERYTLILRPDLEKFIFEGEETISLTILHPTSTITLHAVGLTVHTATIGDKNASLSYDEKAKTVSLSFDSQLPMGTASLHITFSGKFSEHLKGLYKSAYVVDGQPRYMATTQLEEIGAREVFPCIDDPFAKAVFDIIMEIPQHLTAISNTVVEKEEQLSNGYKRVTFSPTPRMATYALAFIVGEFESIEKKAENGVLVRVFVTPGKKDQAQFALETAAAMLPFYEEYFDIPYPLPVVDLIAIPDFDAGAMENWGAITFREVAILVDSQKTSLGSKQWVALVIAHELAHMWFGNLVTMEWWTYLWLNEGFASYIEYLVTDKLFPEWNMWNQFFSLDHNSALALDGLKHTHPIETEVKDIDQLKENFDEISYVKGASVIAMLATYLGEKDFRDGLRYYLKKHAYGNATTEDLWEALETVSQKQVAPVMDFFTKKPGYPIVTVSEEKEGLVLSQQRFFASSQEQGTDDTTVWNIPLAVAASEDVFEPTYLMTDRVMKLPKVSSGNYVKINAEEKSFFRTIYSNQLYTGLKKAIEAKTLSAIDRMGILRDAFDSAEAGLLPTSQALLLARSYTNETAYSVWTSLSGKIASVHRLLANGPLEKKYNQFAKGIFAKIAGKVGWDKEKNETTDETLLRSLVLYAYGKYGDEATIEKAKNLFWHYVEDKTFVDSDIRGITYVLVAENGGEKEWETLLSLYAKESLQQEKNRIMVALCSFKQTALIQKTIDWAFSNKSDFQAEHVRLQDKARVAIALFQNEFAQQRMWEYLKSNWEKISLENKGTHGFGRIIEGAASIVSEHIYEDIQSFFKAHPTPELTRTIQQVLEQIESNIAWAKRDREDIEKFLLSARE